MTQNSQEKSEITVSRLIKSLTEWQNLFVLVFSILGSVFAAFQTWDKNKIIASLIAGSIVAAAFIWIYYRESKKKKAILPEEVTDSAFVGLNSFDEKDQARFFGRGADTGELRDKVTHRDYRFGVLTGESGSGKTSLINAGLIPKLKEKGYHAVYLRLLNDPEQVIRKTVGKELKIEAKPEESLKEYLARVTTETNAILILCCDQFEEFFIRVPTESSREGFMSIVVDCYQDNDLPVKFLFALREDFLSRILEFNQYFNKPMSTDRIYRLKNFDTDQAADIIQRSVQCVNLPFETGLSKRVADNLSINGRVLPTELQIVCLQMQRRHIFSEEKYKAIGEKEALVHSYLEDVVRLSGNERDVKLVLRSMISEENTKLALTLSEISERTQKKPHEVQAILDSFISARLVREIQDQQPWKYEFTHEYLIDRVNEISGSVMDEVKKANYAFRQYLRQYAIDKKTRIPFGQVLKIRRYSDLKRNAREQELLGKSFRDGAMIYGIAVFVLLAVSATGLKIYIDQQNAVYRFANGIGTLNINNHKNAKLRLARIYHYKDARKYPPGDIEFDGNTVELEGPADYMLTDTSETSPLTYPVHIEGYQDTVELTLVTRPKGVPADMVFIPSGEFRMGDKNRKNGVDADAPPHDVMLEGFLIDKTEVSNQAYRNFIETGLYESKDFQGKPIWSDDGWEFVNRLEEKLPRYWDDENFNKDEYPVVGVSWYEAETYCRFVDKRLPTEAEWEKAGRGPEGYERSFGNHEENLASKANSYLGEDGFEKTAPVIWEKYGANGYGLYHMSGNVWEWVQDGYDDEFYTKPGAKLNPLYNEPTELKVIRGGSWNYNPQSLRASFRYRDYAWSGDNDIGFRCARTL